MFRTNLFLSAFIAVVSISKLSAQTLPLKIEVAPVSPDVNQQFGVLHFSAVEKDKFSILYYQPLNASIVASKEFLRDTGSVAYTDAKYREAVSYSDNALLLIKQTVDKNGIGTIEKIWVLAKRKMESADGYKLYFRPGFNHPVIKTNSPVTLTVYNLDNVTGLSQPERDALTLLVKREYLPEAAGYQNTMQATSLADDIMKVKSDFKSLKRSGLLFKGDLPKSEDVLSRFTITKEKSMVITKAKEKSKEKNKLFTLKFYLTSDFQTFECVDSTQLDGDISLTSVEPVYTENTEIAGASASFVLKSKDEQGNETAMVLTYLLNENNDVLYWKHSVGKNKLSSFQPKVCWYKGSDLMILGTNGEKFFKPAYQLHQFSKGKDAANLYPLTEEEKGSEKFKYVKTFQVETPVGAISPLADKQIPMLFYTINGTQYVITEGFKKDQNTHADQYLTLTIYRITEDNKVTNIDDLTGYINSTPAKIDFLGDNKEQAYLMLYYPNKVQLMLDKAQMTVSPLETATSRLMPLLNGDFLSRTSAGAVLMSRSVMGTKYTLLYYPGN